MHIYMPKNKFFMLYIGLLSIPLLYNFTVTQHIEGTDKRKKQLYLRLSYFSSYNLAFVAVTMLGLKYSH